MEKLSMGDMMTLNAIHRCVLLKFYRTLNMRAQVRLLETLVHLWDHELGMFVLQGETLELIKKHIYFITHLFHKGEPMNMEGIGQGGDPLSVQDYINTYFLPKTQKSGTQILIGHITSFPLKFIVSTIVRVAGYFSLHLEVRTHMGIAI